MIELPTKRSEVVNYNPKLLILIGKPKAGKSTLAASLEDNLIIDLEDGYRALSVMKVVCNTVYQMFDVTKALYADAMKNKKKPYHFITIDNATRLEEMCLPYAADLYRNTAMGQAWGYLRDKDGKLMRDKDGNFIKDKTADVRMLPNGSGWLYVREAVKKSIKMFQPYCDTLILIAHIKEKQIRKDGMELSEYSIDLAGKMGDIMCGEADAVGLVYRQEKQTIISFEGGGNTLMEARPLHLRGKKIVVAESDENDKITTYMDKIFI